MKINCYLVVVFPLTKFSFSYCRQTDNELTSACYAEETGRNEKIVNAPST